MYKSIVFILDNKNQKIYYVVERNDKLNNKNQITSLFSRVEDFIDLYILELGKEKCHPDKIIEHIPRSYYRIHYIISGKGHYIVDGEKYLLKSGDFFLTLPDSKATWQPSKSSPWTYTWVGFNGLKAKRYLEDANLHKDNLVVSYNKDSFFVTHFLEMYNALNHFGNINIRCLGHLYIILSKLIEINEETKPSKVLSKKQSNVREAVLFIRCNYTIDLKIKDVAESLYISPNYLSNIFKEVLQMTPQEYLMRVRIEKACELLSSNPTIKINEVSKKIGYKDPLHFSKNFKSIIGVSPKKYQHSETKNNNLFK